MHKKNSPAFVLCLLCLLALCPAAAGQGPVVDAQRARAALEQFPESQAVLFVNMQRLFRDALPRLVPPAELQKVLAEPKKVGIDLNQMEYAIVGVRLVDPPPPSGIPEFIVLVRGNFSAEALMTIGRVAADAQGMKAAEESYNSKTINIINLRPPAKPEGEAAAGGGAPPKNPFPFAEIGATALDSNTLVVGIPSYVRAAIDAAGGGQGRLRQALVDLGSSNPSALTSLTVDVPDSLPQYLQKLGVPPNQEVNKILGWLEQLSLSVGMTATDFNLQSGIRTDAAEHANAISGLIKMGTFAIENQMREDIAKKTPRAEDAQMVLGLLESFTNNVQGSTVMLNATVPQQTLAALVKRNMAPKNVAPKPGLKPATRGRAPARRTARRRPAKRG